MHRNLFLIKALGFWIAFFLKKGSGTGIPYEFYKMFQNSFFIYYLQATASATYLLFNQTGHQFKQIFPEMGKRCNLKHVKFLIRQH